MLVWVARLGWVAHCIGKSPSEKISLFDATDKYVPARRIKIHKESSIMNNKIKKSKKNNLYNHLDLQKAVLAHLKKPQP